MASAPSNQQLSAALDGLKEVLERERLSGDGITIQPETLEQLRQLPARLQARSAKAAETAAATPPRSPAGPVPESRVREEATPPKVAAPSPTPAEDDFAFAARGIEKIVPEGNTKTARIDFLRNLAEHC